MEGTCRSSGSNLGMRAGLETDSFEAILTMKPTPVRDETETVRWKWNCECHAVGR